MFATARDHTTGSSAVGHARPSADDDEVVVLALYGLVTAPRLHHRLDGRAREALVPVDDHRKGRIDQAQPLQQEAGLGGARLVPLVRLRGPGEKVAQAVVLGIHPPADDLQRWPHRAHSPMVLTARRVKSRAEPPAVYAT
jgi:hypothetical protein